MIKDFYILPKPKILEVGKSSGIRLSRLLMIYVNKHRIKDTSLMISSKFNKHLGVFIRTSPIKDTFLDVDLGENYFFACITTEDHFLKMIRDKLNDILKEKIAKVEEKFDLLKNNQDFEDNKFNLMDEMFKNEGYFIDIRSETIWLISKTERGYYYGVQTLIQVIENSIFSHNNPDEFIIMPEL
ncbi:MAG: glycoside hydrolase family 20 zincin-like fold domain-containing protein, partial [Promethearchaeota archaeon]